MRSKNRVDLRGPGSRGLCPTCEGPKPRGLIPNVEVELPTSRSPLVRPGAPGGTCVTCVPSAATLCLVKVDRGDCVLCGS